MPISRGRALDGIVPTDFLRDGGTWPEGPFASPWRAGARLAPEGLTREQERLYVAAVERLALTVRFFQVWIKRRGTTREGVARALNVSRGTLSALENGKHFPSWDVLERLRAYCDIS